MSAPLTADRDALADLARRQRFLDLLREGMEAGRLSRVVLAKPRPGSGGGDDVQRVTVRPVTLKGAPAWQFVLRHPTRDITRNEPAAQALASIDAFIGTRFLHAHAWRTDPASGREEEWQLLVNRKGRHALLHHTMSAAEAAAGLAGAQARVADAPGDDEPADGTTLTDAAPFLAGEHNRAKRRPLSLALPWLRDLGVTDAQGRLVPAMARKWKQINKFTEVLAHAVDGAGFAPGATLHVVDFGAGKGYLTFATWQHLRDRGFDPQVVGVELRPGLTELCERAARAHGLDGLRFECGDVRSHVPPRLDIMIARHACDTATDFALFTAVKASATVIVASPCCHKQLRPQMALPPLLKPVLQHGIHLGQQAEMVTDGLRALLLEAEGYEAQVFEFVALEHTSKNKMILASRRPGAREGASEGQRRQLAQRRERLLAEVAQIKDFYGVKEQALEALLAGEGDDAGANDAAAPVPAA